MRLWPWGGARRGKPPVPPRLLLQWHITERCNQTCAHCYQDPTPARELPLEDLLGFLAQYEDLLDSLSEGAPARGHITVTGGEPFVRDDSMKLLERIASKQPRISFAVLSNGSLIDRPRARELRALRPAFVQVSLEGGSEMQDRIRGAGAFESTTNAIRNLVRERVPAYVAFTAHQANYQEFPTVVRIARDLGVTRVWADRLIPEGRGASLEPLSRAETREFFGIMRRARDHGGFLSRTEVAMHRALQFLEGGRPYRCSAGDRLLALMPGGDVYPCRRLPILAGNLKRTTLQELYRESPLLQSLRAADGLNSKCSCCRYAVQCRGGLRCLAYATTGDPFSPDPGCWITAAPPDEV